MQLKQKDLKPLRDKLLKEQDGKCALCGKKSDNMHLDHNHENGRIRKVLCAGCNLCEGKVVKFIKISGINLDEKVWLANLIDYLGQPETEYIHPENITKQIKKFKAMNKGEQLTVLKQHSIAVPEKATKSDLVKLYRKTFN